VPEKLLDLIESMGVTAEKIATKTGVVISTRDTILAAQVEKDDDEMDQLHRQDFPQVPEGCAVSMDQLHRQDSPRGLATPEGGSVSMESVSIMLELSHVGPSEGCLHASPWKARADIIECQGVRVSVTAGMPSPPGCPGLGSRDDTWQ
jgi:hypothetical protein